MSEGKKITAKDLGEKLAEAKSMDEAVKFKPFDKDDWDSFAGATKFKDGEDPLISELEDKDVSSDGSKKEYDFVTLIMDGLAVEAIFQADKRNDTEVWRYFLTKNEDKPLEKKEAVKLGNKLGLKTPVSPKLLKSKKFKKTLG